MNAYINGMKIVDFYDLGGYSYVTLEYTDNGDIRYKGYSIYHGADVPNSEDNTTIQGVRDFTHGLYEFIVSNKQISTVH